MAQWKETLEPYIKVQERIKTVSITPTAGEDLIIGCVLISDAGPSTPTLITDQKSFLETYASKSVSQDYIKSINNLYTGADKELAGTMWQNAYRLAGSNTLLVVRASKGDDVYFAKPLQKEDLNTYVLRDGELLKKIEGFKITIDDTPGDAATRNDDGWSININGVGIIGNRTDDNGAEYDYYVSNLVELAEQLNECSKFFSPDYAFYSATDTLDDAHLIDVTAEGADLSSVKCVVFNEVYVGSHLIDTTDERCNNGVMYLIVAPIDYTSENTNDQVIDLNDSAHSGFVAADYYATNVYNSATDLKVRIRRFNHDAVTSKKLDDTSNLSANSESPYNVLSSVLDIFTANGTKEPSASNLERDFYEIAVLDPSINEYVSYFNVGNISGRGDMSVDEVNSYISMIGLNLPEDLHELGINYYGYNEDDYIWAEITDTITDAEKTEAGAVATLEDLQKIKPVPGSGDKTIYKVEDNKYYEYTLNGEAQLFADLTIKPEETKIICVGDSELKAGIDKLVLDEVYVTEGLTDLGNSDPSFQKYVANIAVNENYFYPVSTVNSTNYMAIGNSASKMTLDSYKLYMSAPWDIDTGTFGWKFFVSPSVLYWEAVARNRRNNEEFRGVFGQVGGIVSYQNPVTEFNKKTRQLLLTKRVNTVLWNNQTSAWNMNDNYTFQNEDNIMSDEGNSRLMIRISKAIPVILKQFIGRKISDVLCKEVEDTIRYFFKFTIIPMVYSVDAYEVFCKYDEVLARQNKIKVVVNVRYQRSLKYINVINNAFDVGMDISGTDEI